MLVRGDMPPGHLNILNVKAQRYTAALSITNPILGTLPNPRGFIAAEVKIRGTRFEFVTTHLGDPARDSQAVSIDALSMPKWNKTFKARHAMTGGTQRSNSQSKGTTLHSGAASLLLPQRGDRPLRRRLE